MILGGWSPLGERESECSQVREKGREGSICGNEVQERGEDEGCCGGEGWWKVEQKGEREF